MTKRRHSLRSRLPIHVIGVFALLALGLPPSLPAAPCGLIGGAAAGSVTAEEVLERRLEGLQGAGGGEPAPIDRVEYDRLEVATFGLG